MSPFFSKGNISFRHGTFHKILMFLQELAFKESDLRHGILAGPCPNYSYNFATSNWLHKNQEVWKLFLMTNSLQIIRVCPLCSKIPSSFWKCQPSLPEDSVHWQHHSVVHSTGSPWKLRVCCCHGSESMFTDWTGSWLSRIWCITCFFSCTSFFSSKMVWLLLFPHFPQDQ